MNVAPASPELDRLFGLLAVQNGFATAPAVKLALARVPPGQTLADVLQSAGSISSKERSTLDELVHLSLERNGGDARRSLDSLGGDAALTPAPETEEFESFGGDAPLANPTPTPDADASAAGNTPSAPALDSGAALPVSIAARDRYLYRREQGRGGQSRVQVAFDRDIAREIAIKELLPERRGHPHAVARFIREARITGQLEHPNIVPVYELGRREDGSYYCAQKLVRGRTFSDALRGCRSLADRLRLLPHFEGLCQAVAYAHSKGVVHRDIKPDNVMVGEFGETVVLDWGLAKARGHEASPTGPQDKSDLHDSSAGETVVGSAIGTPAYMSPEQGLGELAQIDERSDVWSLGVMLFEILTGRTPFQGESAFEVIGQVIHAPMPSIRELAPEAPRDLAAIAEKALQRARDLRYRNGQELTGEIEAFRLGRRVAAYDYSSFELLRRFVAKNRVLSGIVLLSVLLVSAAAVVAFRRDAESRKNLARAFVEKARVAERDLSWGEAAVFRAAARTYDPAADLPYGVAFEGAFEAHPVARLSGHQAPVDFMAVSPSVPLLVTGARDQTVGFWDLSARKLIARVPAHQGSSDIAVAFAPSGQTVASLGNGDHGTLTVWDPGSHAPLFTLPAPNRQMALAISPDDDTLALATHDGLELWSLRRRALVRHWPVKEAVTALAFVEGGAGLLSGHENGAMHVWNVADGALLRTLAAHQQWISYLRLSRDGKLATSTSYDRRVGLWDVEKTAPVALFEGHEGPALESAFSPDAKLIASVGFDGALRVWHVASRAQVARILVPGVSLASVSFSADGRSLIAAGNDQVLRVWNVPSQFVLDAIDQNAQQLTHADEGRLVAFVGPDKSIGLWDVTRRALRARLSQSVSLVDAISLSGDGASLAARSPSDLKVWDVAAKKVAAAVSDFPLQMLASALSRDGKQLAIGLASGQIVLRRVGDERLGSVQLNRGGGTPVSLSFSPDGRILAASYSDGALVLWDPATGSRRTLQSISTASVEFFAFLSDGQALWQGADHVAHLADLSQDRERARLGGERSVLTSAAISRDGVRVITAAQDSTVRLWNARTGELLARLDHHWASVSSVAEGPEPDTFTTGGSDGRLRRFHLVHPPPPRAQLQAAEEQFGLKLVGIELVEASAAGN